jgi:hypothetical protein
MTPLEPLRLADVDRLYALIYPRLHVVTFTPASGGPLPLCLKCGEPIDANEWARGDCRNTWAQRPGLGDVG